MHSCAKHEDFQNVSRTEEKTLLELFREKQILFPAKIICVTLTCSQMKPLSPKAQDAEHKDADPLVPLLLAVGGMASSLMVSSAVF